MTISLRAAGATLSSTVATTAVNPLVPTGTLADDLSVLSVCCKPFGTVITTPTGWTKIAEITDGSVAAGVGTGSVKAATYVRLGAPVGAIGAITFSGASACDAVIQSYMKDPFSNWDTTYLSSTGIDNTSAANLQCTATTDLVLLAQDYCHVTLASNNVAGSTPNTYLIYGGNPGTNWQGGATTAANTNLRTAHGVTTGNAVRLTAMDRRVDQGSLVPGTNQVAQFDNTASNLGCAVFLRLRTIPVGRNDYNRLAPARAANW